MSGIAHVGVEPFVVTKERSEVMAFTNTLGFSRWGGPVYLLYLQCIGIYSFREKRFCSPKIFFLYKLLSWQENKTDAGKDFHISFCLSLITNSNLKLNTNYMISNCNTHNSIFALSYVNSLNINSTLFTIIFKRGHYKNHHVFRTSLRLLQITAAYIYPVTSVWNSFKFCRSLPIIFTILCDLGS